MSKSVSPDFSSGGDVFEYNGKKASVYDFRVPKKVTKTDMKALERVTDSFSKLMTAGLCSMTRESCLVYNPNTEEMSISDYINTLPRNTMIGILSFSIEDSDLRDNGVMFHIPPELSYYLIDILLGGNGQKYDSDRPHTDIETSILRYLIGKFCDILAVAWENVAHGHFHYEKTETNPRLVQMKSENDVKLIMSFDVTVKELKSSISIAFSGRFFEDLMIKVNSGKSKNESLEPTDHERDSKRKKMILDTLSETYIDLKAVFSEITLDIQDVMSLREGDIIPLDKKITDDITIMVDDTAWFKGKLGQVNIKKAVKITDCIHEEL